MSDTFNPMTFMAQLAATAVPPLSLITFLITVRVGAMSSLVMVQVFTSPRANVMLPFAAQSPPQTEAA